MVREFLVDTAQEQLRKTAAAAPAHHDQVRPLALGELGDRGGGAAVDHQCPVPDPAVLQGRAPVLLELVGQLRMRFAAIQRPSGHDREVAFDLGHSGRGSGRLASGLGFVP